MTYGRDTYMVRGELRTGRTVSGVELIAQACYLRLTTPRGTLDDGDEGVVYGLDVCDFLGRRTTADAVDTIAAAVEAELLKDDRIASVEASATIVRGTDGLDAITLDARVFPYAEAGAAFVLSLAVSQVTVALLGVTPI